MNRQMLRTGALLMALGLVLTACGGGTTEEPAGSEASAATGGSEAAGNDALVEAYTSEPAQLGLDPITPPDDLMDVETVDTSQYAVDGPARVAFAIQAPEFSWPATYNDAVKARAEEMYPDAELILSPTGLGETDTQLGTIEDLLVQQPDVLIVTPLTDVRGAVEQAAAQGTPVVLCTGTAETDAYVSRVDRDNYLNGAIGAEWIAREMDYQGNVVLLSGPAGTPTAEARLEAATNVFNSYEDITILAQEATNWDAAEGKTAMQAILAQGEQIDAVWTDGAGQATGAIEAYIDAGEEIPPFAAEPLNGVLRLADEHGFPFVAVGYPPSQSSQCLDTAMAIVNGEPVDSFVNVEVPIFDTESLDEWYRPECKDDLWLPTPLSDEELVEQGTCEG
jgi:ribose transport system substrate-binding protein